MGLPYISNDQGPSLSDLLIFEVAPIFSREAVTVVSATDDLLMGTVLALDDDEYIPYLSDTPASGASHLAACAVLMKNMPKGTNTVPVIARGAVVNAAALVWDDDATTAEKTAAVASLKALTILVKE